MSQSSPPAGDRPAAAQESPRGDPWHAFGYVVSGVGLYGFLGWLADQWLGTGFLVALGIVTGATLGLYLTFSRFNRERPPAPPPSDPQLPIDHAPEPDPVRPHDDPAQN
jgi:ATP synthase protein I